MEVSSGAVYWRTVPVPVPVPVSPVGSVAVGLHKSNILSGLVVVSGGSRGRSGVRVLRRSGLKDDDNDNDTISIVSKLKEQQTDNHNDTDNLNLPFPYHLLNLDFQLDSEDTYKIILYAGGSLIAVWLLSAILSAIDSIPVLPKLLEVVGLGYSLWFTTRYLLFKKNREELTSKIEEIKQEVLGSSNGSTGNSGNCSGSNNSGNGSGTDSGNGSKENSGNN